MIRVVVVIIERKEVGLAAGVTVARSRPSGVALERYRVMVKVITAGSIAWPGLGDDIDPISALCGNLHCVAVSFNILGGGAQNIGAIQPIGPGRVDVAISDQRVV